MKVCVLDSRCTPYFQSSRIASIVGEDKVVVIQTDSTNTFDGSIFAQIPADTTHLVTALADRLGQSELQRLSQLCYVGLAYTGWWDKYFDRAALEERKIVVTNNPVYAPNAVAEAHLTALLCVYRSILKLPRGTANFTAPIGREVFGKTLGIFGLGNIGSRMASLALAMGMSVLSTSNRETAGVLHSTKSELLKRSDVISLHVPKSAG